MFDESGFPKKGRESVGVARQYCGTLGQVETCQVGVFAAYASRHGYALVDKRLFLPEPWCTHASAARRTTGKVPEDLTFHTKPQLPQDYAMNSADVVAFLEHLLREVSGCMVIIWDGAPIHRSQVVREFLSNGAVQRLHLERLPTYAPELNPGEGLWAQLKGVEHRNGCCGNLPQVRGDLRDAVKRVRRKSRIIQGFFRGAGL